MILVDELREHNKHHWNRLWCHMMTDDLTPEGLEELHAMADVLGLRREWFENHPVHPHYDLPPHLREEAIRLGAQAVTSREMLRRCNRVRVRERGVDERY